MTTGYEAQSNLSTVAITRAPSYEACIIEEAVSRQFDLLGGVESFVSRGDKVLIKPNFIAPKPAQTATQTDPGVIYAVAKLLKDAGAKPFIGDSPAWKNTEACIKILNLEEPLKKLGVPIVQLNKPKRIRIDGANLGISTVAIEADKIINLPKFKAHQQLTATFAVKNMFGCICGKEKAFRHFSTGGCHDSFCKMLLGIYEFLAPVVTIIDGVVAMEGMGPLSGEPKPLGFLIGSKDPIACEMMCCELIDLDPNQLPVIETARKINFGCSDRDRINVVGDSFIEYKCTDFKPARQTPLYFTFPRICKSLAKQIILRIKGACGKK